MAVPQVSEVEVGQELLPGLAAGIRRADRQLALERVGEQLASGVLHDERARRSALSTIGCLPVQGDRPGTGAGQSAQHAHEGRFPGAVLSSDAGDLPCRKIRVKPLEHRSAPVGEAQVPAGQAYFRGRRGVRVALPGGHPGLGRTRVHEGPQTERPAFLIAHRVEFLAAPPTRDRSAFHEENLIGEPPQEVEAVLDDDDRHPLFFEDRECASHVGDGVRIQVRRRFVGQEDRGTRRQRAGERHLLQLPARQARQFPVHQVRDTHEFGGTLAALDQGFSVATVVLPAKDQLLGDGVTKELGARILEDRRAQVADLGQGDLGEVATVDPHRAFQLSRRHLGDEAGERAHERRLPTAGGPTHESESARTGRHIDPA